MMSAIVPSAQQQNSTTSSDVAQQKRDHVTDRQSLQEDLLAAAKLCHVRFGGKAELATESDTCVTQLCRAFERIFTHGLRVNRIEKLNSAIRHVSDFVSGNGSKAELAFWPCIREQLTWHEQERFSVLRKTHTDYGRGRAWLRAALNERSLERHLHSILNEDTLSPFYEEWSFLMDQEKSSVLPNVAAGLGTILFAIRVDNDELDKFDRNASTKFRASQSEPIIPLTLSNAANPDGKKRKKIPTHIISFDDDNETGQEVKCASTSAPATCLNSPMTVNQASSSPSTSIAEAPVDSGSAEDEAKAQWDESETYEEGKVLTPVNDSGNMGGLVPISPLDKSLEDMLVTLPNYLDDTAEIAEAAVEATEPLVTADFQDDSDKQNIEALQLRLVAMGEVLEQAKEDAVTSKLQLARYHRQHQNYLERHELQLQTLNRENELLRQQLRKYVTAVQMLKKDSDSPSSVAEEDPSLDYHGEALQYQEKLIQVAEMHAELMEFNARLTMQLNNKDKLIKRLQAELECLRGPLNEDDLPVEPPCLIHIWVPSAFLTGPSSDVHHVYQIYVRIRDTEWNIYRRYAQFHALYKELKKHDAVITTFEFPPKKTIRNKDAKFVEERRQKLQQWLRRVTGRLSQCSPVFTSRPSKQTLISLMPFFGDTSNNEDTRRSTSSSRSNFSTSPQYMGL